MGRCCGRQLVVVVAMTTAGFATFNVAPYGYTILVVFVVASTVGDVEFAIHDWTSSMKHSLGWKYFWYIVLITASALECHTYMEIYVGVELLFSTFSQQH